jgi:hypothetical protein
MDAVKRRQCSTSLRHHSGKLAVSMYVQLYSSMLNKTIRRSMKIGVHDEAISSDSGLKSLDDFGRVAHPGFRLIRVRRHGQFGTSSTDN